MHRSKRVPNPYFKGIPIDWKLKLPETDVVPGVREGKLSMSFRTRDDAGQKLEFTFPCTISRHGCLVKKDGVMKKMDRNDKSLSEERFSIWNRLVEDPKNKSIMIFNDIIEAVAKHCGHAISLLSKLGTSYDGIMVIPPKIFRIPKDTTVRWISLEKLEKAGQI